MVRRRERDSKRKSSGRDRGSKKSSSRRSSKRSFTYKKRDAESVKKRSTQGAGNRDQIFLGDNIFKVTDDNNIRILPPTWDDPEHYAFDIYVHYGIGPDESAFICLDKLNDSEEKCPICEERSKAEAEGDTDYASSLKPTRRPACYVIDRDNEDDGALIWAMPWTVDRDLSAQSFDKKTGEVIPLDDPYDGFDISFTRQGKGLKTKYVGLSIGRHSSEASDDLDEILDQIQETPIPDALDIKEADYIANVFSGHSNKSSDKNEDDGGKYNDDIPTWKEVHAMDFSELEDLVEDEDLDEIDPDDYDEEDELADAICEEMEIEKPKKPKKDKKRSKNMRRNRR